ncbi:MAG: di-trans,poly-cis-decaprenylcistransferase [Candidatus Aenigmarchaeota archaeon]|nr:di-trans,poly-cis-decaprenylcistransferase [Candidatus Aenigmarchaeota archaeon]
MINHIAIIPDGNRRFAKKMNIPITKSYAMGVDKIIEVMEWSKDLGVKMMTSWGFSTENFKRSALERRLLFRLFEGKIKEFLENGRFKKEQLKVKIIGDINKFPKSLINAIHNLESETEKYNEFQLNLALNYGGRQEIIEACNRILASGIKNIKTEDFSKFLFTKNLPDPDIILRTSGEQRMSGFLPWQSAYSEFVFLKPLWPELQKEEFVTAINEYDSRQRRFGR